MRFFQNASFDFLGQRRRAYRVYAVAIGLLAVGALYMQFARGSWLNYGVDFLGGDLIQVAIARQTDVGEVREVVQRVMPGSEVINFGSDNDFLVRSPAASETGSAGSVAVVQSLNEHFGPGQVRVDRVETVTAKVGNELQGRAAWAVLLSFLATLIYLAIRFEWRYGVAALIATISDVVFTLLFISVMRYEVALPTVAAILTVIGYSLNDKIVIFDRIRENRKALSRRLTEMELINRSVNETLSRTVVTGGSTLLALLALAVLGGEVIREFAIVLIAGILVGTFSSMFVGATSLYDIEQRFGESHVGPRTRKESTRAAL